MTSEDFQKEHGPAFRKFRKTELYAALLSVLEEASPARQEMSRSAGDVLAGGAVFFAKTQQHEVVTELFRNGLNDPPAPRPEREEEYKPE